MISSVLWFLNDMLSVKTDVNVPLVRNKQKTLEKILIFCWHLEGHCEREKYPYPNPYQNFADSEYCFKGTWLLLQNTITSDWFLKKKKTFLWLFFFFCRGRAIPCSCALSVSGQLTACFLQPRYRYPVEKIASPLGSVADPDPNLDLDLSDPYDFGPPGSGSGSVSQRSGSFYHAAKIVSKTLIPSVLWLLFDFLSLKNYVNVPSKRHRQKNFGKKIVYCWHLKGKWQK